MVLLLVVEGNNKKLEFHIQQNKKLDLRTKTRQKRTPKEGIGMHVLVFALTLVSCIYSIKVDMTIVLHLSSIYDPDVLINVSNCSYKCKYKLIYQMITISTIEAFPGPT